MSKVENLQITEHRGRWSATWEQGNRHFDMDMLYGYEAPRNYLQLRMLLDENHCILLPAKEFDLKQYQTYQGHRAVYSIKENEVQMRKDTDYSRDYKHRKVYSNEER